MITPKVHTELEETSWAADVAFDALALITSAVLLWLVSKGLRWEHRGVSNRFGTRLLIATLTLMLIAAAFDISNDGYALATWTGVAPHKGTTCFVVTYLMPKLFAFPADMLNLFLVLRISLGLLEIRSHSEHGRHAWTSSRNLRVCGILLFVLYGLVATAQWLTGIVGVFYRAYRTGFNTQPFYYPENVLSIIMGMMLLTLIAVMAFPLISLFNVVRSSGHAFTLFLFGVTLLAYSIRSSLQVAGGAYVLTQYDDAHHRFANTVSGIIIEDVLLAGLDRDLQCCGLIAMVFLARRAPIKDTPKSCKDCFPAISWPVKALHVKTNENGLTNFIELETRQRLELEAVEQPGEMSNESARNELPGEVSGGGLGSEKPLVYCLV